MKKKLAIMAIFLLSYVVFVIATIPSTFVLQQVTLPKNIQLYGVSGTLWHTYIEQLHVEKTQLVNVDAQLSFWSLLTLSPKVDVRFGDPLLAGAEGQFTAVIDSETLTITELTALISANEIAQQLPLPIPASAQGEVNLAIAQVSINLHTQQCSVITGEASWHKAGVKALDQKVKLGQFTSKLACEDGVLALHLSPKNDLGLTFSAYVRKRGRVSGSGYLKPGNNFPASLNGILPFLGKQDSQGRYRLSF